MNPAKLFKDIAASAARFRAVPQKVAASVGEVLTRYMTNVSAAKGRKLHGTATPVEGGVMVRVYTDKPHVGPGWRLAVLRSIKRHMRAAANGKD